MTILKKMAKLLHDTADRVDILAYRHSQEQNTFSDRKLDAYVNSAPTPQNAIDALPGWNMSLPPHAGVTAGAHPFYQDDRIYWAIDQFGSLQGQQILEIGPLEASHTYLLEQYQPLVLDAVEANKMAYLRCLVVKELLNMNIARFHLGDASKWLENNDKRYDFVVASGILYHMQDPVKFLERIAARTNSFYLWTHYVDEVAMPMNDVRRGAFVGQVEVEEFQGHKVRLWQRSYHGAWRSNHFCGGIHDRHRWMERKDMLALIAALGFDDVRIAHDDWGHDNGPSFSVFAKRS